MSEEVAILARGLTKTYGHGPTAVRAVRGIDLTIDRGEVIAMLGPNGAGKTTTLDMVMGFIQPTSGSVEVLGKSPRAAVAAGRVGGVLQTGGLIDDFTVAETVEIIASCHKDPLPLDEAMERAGLGHVATRKVSKCSGGEQQRLKFALALLSRPYLLLLDEPTVGMDVAARRDFWEVMHREAAEGRTVIFATHYLAEAEEFAQRTILMANGSVVADGPTDVVRSQFSQSTVSFAIAVEQMAGLLEALEARPDVTSVEQRGGRAIVKTNASDDVARWALSHAGVFDLQVAPGSLDDAFVHLTRSEEKESA